MFERLATLSNIAWQAEFTEKYFLNSSKHFFFTKQTMFDEQCFVTSQNRKNILMDKQMINVWQAMFDRFASAKGDIWLLAPKMAVTLGIVIFPHRTKFYIRLNIQISRLFRFFILTI